LWDNHHHPIDNLRASLVADVVFVAHWEQRQYVNHPCVLPGVHMPLCTRQWSPQLIVEQYPNGLPTDRSDEIYGGYGNYGWAAQRNEFIQQFARRHPKHSIYLVDLDDYWRQSTSMRLQQWMNHKVHLVVPVANDLSTRVFEALVTGQIPLVPDDIPDLDRAVPTNLQDSLPILRYRAFSIESAHEAYRAALARFAADGSIGVQRRFEFVRNYHSLNARIAAFAEFIRRPHQYEIGGDGRVRQWTNWK